MRWQELWSALRQVTSRERQFGCTDGSVVGGYAAHGRMLLKHLRACLNPDAAAWGAKLAIWESRLADYQRLSTGERQALLEQFDQLLTEAELRTGLFHDPPVKEAEPTIQPRPLKKVNDGDVPIQFMRGVGPQRAGRLKKLGIETVADLLWHLPARYVDRSSLSLVASVQSPGDYGVAGIIRSQQHRPTRPGLIIYRAQLDDGTGILPLIWFNRPHLHRTFPPGTAVVVFGKAEYRGDSLELHVEDMELQGEARQGIVPVYPATEGLPQRQLQQLCQQALANYGERLRDAVPASVQTQLGLMTIAEAMRCVHLPTSLAEAEAGRRRLAFTEVFLLQMAWQMVRRRRGSSGTGVMHQSAVRELAALWQLLPYPLTEAQQRVIREISQDMERATPMNRLLQGDVGAGKTVVAASVAVKAVASGFQAAFMAPTEILAEQHAINWQRLLAPMGIPVGHLSGGMTKRRKEELLKALQDGSVSIVVGTHALLQQHVVFRRLGLVIIDEQHRFGVRQRATLWGKGQLPDLLVMTATPIPRTLAMTLYGDLDVSVLDQRPPGRQPIKTAHVSSKAWPRIEQLIRREIAQGGRAYVVCPAIEENEELDIAAVEQRFKVLSEDVFPDLAVGMLHGKLKKEAKAAAMEAFAQGKTPVLVATTVVEVGIDVPEATVMVIEDAQRFGLAQLHQLRGRVGRGQSPSYCVLVADKLGDEGRQRMQAMVRTDDGFVLAEEDLKLRGPGEMIGTKQSGIPAFKVADLERDSSLITQAREWAVRYLMNDPHLQAADSRVLADKIRTMFAGLDIF
ncbi:ATP-dependent DNA helicase RecG [Heliophilum fasciatum]|uniref:ATP-dependent DNA helicase RecG n=1 Tax=Heliophilum fasciatum TaxID=35700 RepID=A0A4R2RN23_9FIRM|nr:ATP-dependent DNA helicase RecG [Heliophilum fasciatum]MCW2278404.1 ATP-dependent DNA helicase RecG [Heliophilum fasciatum]TCP63697.1 ATP-dependent DNA helicase RecG [Heliophilum fasciatum]